MHNLSDPGPHNKTLFPPTIHTVVGSFRLQAERAKEEEIHKKIMAELAQPLETTPPTPAEDQKLDYIAQVEHLQQLV